MKVKYLIEFFWATFYLDYLMLVDNLLSFTQKIDFLFKKYYLLFYGFIIPFQLGKNKIKVLGKNFFYDSGLGLAGLQGIITRHRLFLQKINKNEISTIIDIGANVGSFSLLCSMMFPKAKILSFEPIPKTFNCLVNNSSEYKNIKPYNFAVSNFFGQTYMEFSEDSSLTSRISNETSELKVNTTTLKEIYTKEKLKNIDLLKIDVESFEHLVLEGAGEVLKNVKYLLIELTIAENDNYTISKLFSMLYGKGFNFQIIYFRNASDKSYGEILWMDCLLENIEFKNNII